MFTCQRLLLLSFGPPKRGGPLFMPSSFLLVFPIGLGHAGLKRKNNVATGSALIGGLVCRPRLTTHGVWLKVGRLRLPGAKARDMD
jgi:hypothetical protein